MKYLFVILLAAVGLFSCEDIVTEVDLPEEESRVVVSSFISPTDTLVTVYLLESSPLFSDNVGDLYYDDYYRNDNVIREASVFIAKQNSAFVALSFDEEKQNYSIDSKVFPIEYGQSYNLKVVTKEGKEVFASTTVPSNYFSEIDTKADKIDSEDSYNESYNVSVSWLDEKAVGNYYQVAFQSCTEYGCNNYYSGGDRLDMLLTDEKKDGERISINNKEIFIYSPYQSSEKNDVSVVITKLDKVYYDFLKYTYNYEENPFSEPSTAVTNIEGGLGVFVGYATFKKELVLE